MTYKTRREVAGIDDLQVIFTKIYSAELLTIFFNQFLAGAIKDQAIFSIVEADPILHHPGKMLKKHTAAALKQIIQDKRLLLTFYNQQSDICRKALDHIVWYGDKNLGLLESIIEKTISKKNNSSRGQWEPYLLKSGLELFLFEKNTDSYYYYNQDKKKESITVFLPEPVSMALRKAIPKPDKYYLTPLKRKQKTTFTHCSELPTLAAIPKIIQFINLGHLSLKKNGTATVKGLRDLSKISELSEFYPDSEPNTLQRLKGIMLSTFLLTTRQQAVDTPTTLSKPHEYLRSIFRQWLKMDDFIFIEHFFTHLKILRNTYIYYQNDKETNIKNSLRLILKKLPKDGWISLKDILSFVQIHKINLLEFDQGVLDFRHYEGGEYYDMEEWESVNRKNIHQVVYAPILKAFFFLAATLGLVEIGYNYPENSQFRRLKHEYLTEYDGLQLVKLTRLGAYISGKTREYTVDIKENKPCKLHLDRTRLLLTMEGIDPLTTLNLKQIMEQAGTGRYMLTNTSLLKGCHNKQDVEKKIALFKQTISQTAPPIWHDFFKMTLGKIDPISADPALRVFKIVQNQELFNVLTTDPQISALILKVEGLRIAVELGKVSKLTHLLKKHGFLVSNESLFVPG